MTNKYLEKITLLDQEKKASIMTSGLKRVGIGATVGAGIGALAGGKDHRVAGALGGAAVGGAAGGLMAKAKPMAPKSPALLGNSATHSSWNNAPDKVVSMGKTELLDKV